MTSKSPFLVFQNFITEDECTKYINELRVEPDVDTDGKPISMVRTSEPHALSLGHKLMDLMPQIEEHFGLKYKSMENFQFWQHPVRTGLLEEPHCDNSAYKRKKWLRVSTRDLTCVLWFKTFEDNPPFDVDKHVYGGKLEFPVYNFGFQPQAGTLVVFPSNERFIQATSALLVGELNLAKTFIHGEGMWLYNPEQFPGDFRTWFADIV